MRPASSRRRRQQSRRGDHGGGEAGGGSERWLLTYSDMITLLLALFVVLFSISAVNVSKFKTLKETLEQAFSPHLLSGGGSILPDGGAEATKEKAAAAIEALHAQKASAAQTAAEQEQFQALKRKLDEYAREHGFANQIETVINQRGLVIRLLTDRVLFDSGSATLKPQAAPLLGEISNLVNLDRSHPISVEGNTDDVPISTSEFPSNWELSVARATGVVTFMIGHGVAAKRLEASGVAGERPIAPNTSDRGRERNRRVEIALLRGSSPEGGLPQ
ncbi:MAG TPA: flagellar motor protein MotB [Solirubrobacterales bacterium]|nr:flagellar motor protein MotB [Solirubrobacterales bacterium]